MATVSHRRAVDEVRSAHIRHRAVATHGGPSLAHDGTYEPDVDDEITNRHKYRQWLLSIRLRLNAREQQAVSLCILHQHSRKDASKIMRIDIKRLDKIIRAANKKLDGTLEAINRGDWCQDHRITRVSGFSELRVG